MKAKKPPKNKYDLSSKTNELTLRCLTNWFTRIQLFQRYLGGHSNKLDRSARETGIVFLSGSMNWLLLNVLFIFSNSFRFESINCSFHTRIWGLGYHMRYSPHERPKSLETWMFAWQLVLDVILKKNIIWQINDNAGQPTIMLHKTLTHRRIKSQPINAIYC